MRPLFAIALLILPLLAVCQNSDLTESQSRARIDKLAKLVNKYDARYENFNFYPDCNFAIFTDSNNLQGIVDIDGNVLLPCEYHIFQQHGTSLFLVVSDTSVGLIDKDFHWRLPMEYVRTVDCLECIDMGNIFERGYACLLKDDYHYRIVDTNGRTLADPKTELAFGADFENDLLFFYDDEASENSKMWVTDISGKMIIGPYQWIGRFSEGLACFEDNDQYGFLDLKGNVVIPNRYEFNGWGFKNGVTLVSEGEKQMLINKKGTIKHVFDHSYYVENSLWDNSAFVVIRYVRPDNHIHGVYGLVDANGKELIPLRYRWWYTVNDNYIAMISENNSCDIFDKNGRLIANYQEIIGLNDDRINEFHSDYIAVMKDSKWGFVDGNFKTVIPCQYNDAFYLGYGYGRVSESDALGISKAHFIDMSGKTIVQGPYDDISPLTKTLFKFYTTNPDNYDDMIVGFVDIYGNTTATTAQINKMKNWLKRK